MLLAFGVVALLRLLTIAPDPWEWDEVLLSRAVQSGIDLRAQRPHPPGYPLLVELATSLPGARANPYRALALVGTAGGIAACGALTFLLCVVGLPTGAAVFGGILYALVPSVWLFGVRGYSDAPAAAALLLASALLLQSLKRPELRSALPGLLLVAVTAGLRPQTASLPCPTPAPSRSENPSSPGSVRGGSSRWPSAATAAGYVATLDATELSPGPHALVVTFRAADARERIAQPVPFTWAAGPRRPSRPAP